MAMASIDELLAETGETDSALVEFYESNHLVLSKIPLREIPNPVLDRIALILHGTMLGETQWMAFLNKLGIDDNIAITWIKFKAKSSDELPIYLALRGPLQHKTRFGDVIKVMIDNERFDVLSDIHEFVKSLLKKKSDSSEKWSWCSTEPTAPEFECDMKIEKSERKYENSTENREECKLEKHAPPQYEVMDSDNHISEKFNDLSIDKGRKNILSNSISQKMITVFIPHAEVDSDVAIKLSELLRERQIVAKTLSDLDYILMTDSSETIISILSVVDFVVPVVSETFLKEIHPRGQFLTKKPELLEEDNFSSDSNNHYIYQLLLNEFLLAKCLNFRVRPVLVPNMDRRLLKFDTLLFHSLKLWDSVPKLVDILRKTKEKFL